MSHKQFYLLDLANEIIFDSSLFPMPWKDSDIKKILNSECIIAILSPEPYSKQRKTINLIGAIKAVGYKGIIKIINPLDYLKSKSQYYVWIGKRMAFHNFNGAVSSCKVDELVYPKKFISNREGFGTFVDCSPENIYNKKVNSVLGQYYYDKF